MEIKKPELVIAALLFALSSGPSAALAATIIDFEGIYGGPSDIEDGYSGFDWDNVSVMPYGYMIAMGEPNTGYDNGIVSGSQVAFGGSSFYEPASFSSHTPFSLTSAYVTRAWANGFTRFEGYAGNTLKYTRDIYSTTTAPTFAMFNWPNINKVTFFGADHAVLDNVTVSPVPEPSSYAMMIMGLGFLSTMYRRKAAWKAPAQS